MRYNIRLLGRTKDGRRCRADITVYAQSQRQLVDQAKRVSEDADWHYTEPPFDDLPEGSHITVEHVERLGSSKKSQ